MGSRGGGREGCSISTWVEARLRNRQADQPQQPQLHVPGWNFTWYGETHAHVDRMVLCTSRPLRPPTTRQCFRLGKRRMCPCGWFVAVGRTRTSGQKVAVKPDPCQRASSIGPRVSVSTQVPHLEHSDVVDLLLLRGSMEFLPRCTGLPSRMTESVLLGLLNRSDNQRHVCCRENADHRLLGVVKGMPVNEIGLQRPYLNHLWLLVLAAGLRPAHPTCKSTG